jgi:hypothetical protein
VHEEILGAAGLQRGAADLPQGGPLNGALLEVQPAESHVDRDAVTCRQQNDSIARRELPRVIDSCLEAAKEPVDLGASRGPSRNRGPATPAT